MLEYQQKRKLKKRFYSRTVLISLFILAILFAKATWNVYQKKLESKRNEEKAAAELADLEKRQQALSTDINRLQTKTGVEKEIRDKYSVVKPGEKMIVIVEPNQVGTTTNEGGGFFGRMWQTIKGWFGAN